MEISLTMLGNIPETWCYYQNLTTKKEERMKDGNNELKCKEYGFHFNWI